jgi:hypothetical protein
MPENGHSRDPEKDLLEQLQPFSTKIGSNGGQSGNVSARPRKTGDKVQRICNPGKYDRRCLSYVLGSARRRGIYRKDDVNFKPDQLGREVRESIQLPLSKSVFKKNVLSFNVAKLAKTASKCLDQDFDPCIARSLRTEDAYPSSLARLLRLRGKAKRKEQSA